MTDGYGNVLELTVEEGVPTLKVPTDRSDLLCRAFRELGYNAEVLKTPYAEVDLFGDRPDLGQTFDDLKDVLRFPEASQPDELQDVLDSLDYRSDAHIWRLIV